MKLILSVFSGTPTFAPSPTLFPKPTVNESRPLQLPQIPSFSAPPMHLHLPVSHRLPPSGAELGRPLRSHGRMAFFRCLEPRGRFKVEWTMGNSRFPSSTSGYGGPGSEQPSPTGRDEESESRFAGAECIRNPSCVPRFSPLSASPKNRGFFSRSRGLSKEASLLSLFGIYKLISQALRATLNSHMLTWRSIVNPSSRTAQRKGD